MSDKHDGIDVPDNFAEAERYQRLFVAPMIDAMRVEMRNSLSPVVEQQKEIKQVQAEQDLRMKKIEGSQTKALIGYGVFATGLSIALAATWDWIKGVIR